MKYLVLASALLLSACAAHTSPPTAQASVYGPRLEGFAYPHPVRTFHFTSQGQALEMAYMDIPAQGKANGRTALLLHGKNFCAGTWEETMDVLSRHGYRVLAVDQVGFCKSSKPAGYQFSLSQLAANTRALMTHAGVRKATVMGHSMGGMLAARLAMDAPDAVEKLLLVNPIGLENWQAEGVPYADIDTLYQGELKTTAAGIKNYQLKFYYNGVWKPEYQKWVDMLAGMYAGPGGKQVAWNQAQTSEMIFTQPVIQGFYNLKPPTVLLIGGKDRTAPGANRASKAVQEKLGNYPILGRRAVNLIPNGKLVEFIELGHSPQVEAPEVFHKALLENL